jgi:pimeloyl-ACP methyl ester carboxylesterase
MTLASADKAFSKSILLSGASTVLASHFLFWQTRRAQRNLILVADQPSETIKKELCERLLSSAASYHISVAPEELTERFELVSASLTQSDPINEFWHFPEEQEDIHEVLELARKHSVGRFIYVSSAYAAGRQSGVIPEQLHDLSREFHNQFEEQQCRAEHVVTNYCVEHNIDYSIVRPSIVIGPSQTALGDGPHGFLYSLTKAWSDLGEKQTSISLNAQPKTPINLIPVDHVMADLDKLIETNFAGGPIYHLTSFHTPTIETLITTCQKVLGTNVTVRYADSEATNNELPLLDSYLEDKQFERSLARKDGLTEQELFGYVTECARELRNETPDKIFNRKRLISDDGVPLTAFEGHNTEGMPVVLINALGMPAAFWVTLAKQLEPHFRVLTWETRWVPDFGTEFDSARCGVNDHVKDLVTLLDSYSIPAAHFVAWCNGAQVALNFAAHFPERTQSLVFLNGAFNLPPSVPRSTVDKNMRSMMPRIAARRKDSELFFRIMSAGRFLSGDNAQPQKSAPAPVLAACSNPSLVHLTSATYKTPELLYRYANIIAQSFNEPDHAWTDSVKAPSLVIGNEYDQIADPAGSREIARRLPGAELVILQGDHHTFYEDATVQNRISEFMLQHSKRETAPGVAASGS